MNAWVEICGGIASGKTTLAKLMQDAGMEPLLEQFWKNPFLEAFYGDPGRFAFETEMAFVLQHYHQIKTRVEARAGAFACDFSLEQDLAYSRITLGNRQKEIFLTVYDETRRELSRPQLLVQLLCEEVDEMSRIKARGRDIEKSITLDNLNQLNRAITERVDQIRDDVRILTINSSQVDFAKDDQEKKKTANMILDMLDA